MRPRALARPPAIDPDQYAVESRCWGDEFTGYVVHWNGQWFTWTIRPRDDGVQVYPRPDEAAARDFLDAEMAKVLSVTEQGNRVLSVVAGDEISTRVLFSGDVLDGGPDGIWLATCRAAGGEDCYQLAGFTTLGGAVTAFANRADQAAAEIARQEVSWPELTAGALRYSAASARAGATRAELGDLLRRQSAQIRAGRAVSRVAATVGVSREFLYRILAGHDWTWKGVMAMKRNPSPDPRPPREPPTRGWSAGLQLAVQAPDEAAAIAIAADAVREIGLEAGGEPTVHPAADGVWAVSLDLDLAGVEPFEPDSAQTRLSYLSGLWPEGIPWVLRATEREGTAEWSPNAWDQPPAATAELPHPGIRGIRAQVAAGNP